MYSLLKKREYGLIEPLKLKRAETTKRAYSLELSKTKQLALTHRGGVNSLQVDKTEQKYLLTGGGDGKVHVYDLDFPNRESRRNEPVGSCERRDRHKYAVTSVSWYPFDTGMFITSSHDGTIKVWDTNTMKPGYEFALETRVNYQAMSPIASHCLVASAAAEPRIRLCDLNNGAFTHTLTGHSGSVLSCTWSTTQEFILYSGSEDRTIRVWDIRRAASCLMSLDQDNAVDRDPLSDTNFAHGRGVNGLTMTKDGQFLVSLGLDEKIRLWDTATGYNTFINYGTAFRNHYPFSLTAAVLDTDTWPPQLYVPSDDRQVLLYKLSDGQLVRRLKGHFGRVTSVAVRPDVQEIYSGSNASEIMIWEPSSEGNDLKEQSEEDDMDAWSTSEDDT